MAYNRVDTPFATSGKDAERVPVDPVDIPVQLNIRVPWHYREQLIAEARKQGVSFNRLITNCLVRAFPPVRQ